jgi:hypothetical protein
MAVSSQRKDRVSVLLPPSASAKQLRELGTFVLFCISRIERELGASESWAVAIAPGSEAFESRVTVCDNGLVIESSGSGADAVLATWDAICQLEQRLREARASCADD